MLPEDERRLFFFIYFRLLIFASNKLNLYSVKSVEDLKALGLERIVEIRDALFDNPQLIDEFVEENPFGLDYYMLEIARNWKHFVKGNFIVLKILKKYAVFLEESEPPRAYGVLALTDPFEYFFEPPVLVETVLLPFKGKIVYDGLIMVFPVIFGSRIRRELNELYRKAKLLYGIITKLPFKEKPRKISDEEKLKFYLSTKESREKYAKEIEELIRKSPKLRKLYHQEMNKIHARKLRKELKRMGIKSGWFAVLEGKIIASGKTREEVEEILKKILTSKKREYVFIFKINES